MAKIAIFSQITMFFDEITLIFGPFFNSIDSVGS